MSIIIDLKKCNICGRCVSSCPAGAITLTDETAVVDESLCTLCKKCIDVCPTGAIMDSESQKGSQITLISSISDLEVIDADSILIKSEPKGVALLNIGLKILPWVFNVVGYLLERWERGQTGNQYHNQMTKYKSSIKGNGQKHQHRNRSGRK